MSPSRRQCDHNLAGSIRQWPKFGWEKTSVTRIWLWIDVSFGHTDVYSQPNSGHWHFLAAKFWSLTYPCIQILVTDFCCQPNSGHTDVFSETCITRIFSFLSWFEAEKGFSCFLKTLFHVQGVNIYDISIFFWPRLGPFNVSYGIFVWDIVRWLSQNGLVSPGTPHHLYKEEKATSVS